MIFKEFLKNFFPLEYKYFNLFFNLFTEQWADFKLLDKEFKQIVEDLETNNKLWHRLFCEHFNPSISLEIGDHNWMRRYLYIQNKKNHAHSILKQVPSELTSLFSWVLRGDYSFIKNRAV